MGAQVYKLVAVDDGHHQGGAGEGFRMFSDFPDVMTVRQAAGALHVSEGWLREAIARGSVASFRVGRCIKVPKTALLDFVGGGGDGRENR